MEFIQSETIPSLILVRNSIENDSLLKNHPKMILEFYDKYIRQQDKMPCLDKREFCEEELIRIKKRYLSNKLIKKNRAH